MEVTRSYVVRIYRQESEGVTGLLECVATGQAQSFQSLPELCALLSSPPVLRRSTPSNSNDEEHRS